MVVSKLQPTLVTQTTTQKKKKNKKRDGALLVLRPQRLHQPACYSGCAHATRMGSNLLLVCTICSPDWSWRHSSIWVSSSVCVCVFVYPMSVWVGEQDLTSPPTSTFTGKRQQFSLGKHVHGYCGLLLFWTEMNPLMCYVTGSLKNWWNQGWDLYDNTALTYTRAGNGQDELRNSKAKSYFTYISWGIFVFLPHIYPKISQFYVKKQNA